MNDHTRPEFSPRASTAALAAFLLAALAPGQSPWSPVDMPPSGGGLVFDAARNAVVCVESTGATHEWDGTHWRRVSATGPGPNSGTMTFAASRGVIVLYDGLTGTTWTWNGATWTQVATLGPPPRQRPGIAYDPVRDRVVLHGGHNQYQTYFGDTWEWDFNSWTQVSSSGPVTSQHKMVYDLVRGHTLLFGGGVGLFGTQEIRDTWSWDGQNWTRLATGGPPRGRGPMAYDMATGRTLFIQGFNLLSPAEMWDWDGQAWARVAPSSPFWSNLAYDAARNQMVSVSNGSTGTWDGTAWTTIGDPPPSRSSSFPPALAYDENRERLVVLGSRGTMEWDGSFWNLVSTAGASVYQGVAAAYDPVRGRLVVFGGSSRSGGQETWEWDGSTWTPFTAEVMPPARAEHALAFDHVTNRVLLFGGRSRFGFQDLGDTWAWDGTSWAQVAASGPPARRKAVMASDSLRQRVVMFGGQSFGVTLDSTWEWDGSSWQLASASSPSTVRTGHGMAYDRVRGRTVLYGGNDSSFTLFPDDTWEWDGRTWTRLSIPGFGERENHTMYFDTKLGRVVSFAGRSQSSRDMGFTVLELDSVGAGCAGTAGTPSIRFSTGRPAIGAVLDVELSSLPPAAPVALAVFGVTPQAPAIALGAIGLPGCAQLIATPFVNVALVPASMGSGRLRLTVPNAPHLRGLRLLVQGAVPDPGANAVGFTLTEAAVAVIE